MFFILTFIYGVLKSISDTVADEPHWEGSVFNRFDIGSYFGSKDVTWVRKHNFGNVFKYGLVFVTDIWHTAEMLKFVCILSLVVADIDLYLLPLGYLTYWLGFNSFFEVFLVDKGLSKFINKIKSKL